MLKVIEWNEKKIVAEEDLRIGSWAVIILGGLIAYFFINSIMNRPPGSIKYLQFLGFVMDTLAVGIPTIIFVAGVMSIGHRNILELDLIKKKVIVNNSTLWKRKRIENSIQIITNIAFQKIGDKHIQYTITLSPPRHKFLDIEIAHPITKERQKGGILCFWAEISRLVSENNFLEHPQNSPQKKPADTYAVKPNSLRKNSQICDAWIQQINQGEPVLLLPQRNLWFIKIFLFVLSLFMTYLLFAINIPWVPSFFVTILKGVFPAVFFMVVIFSFRPSVRKDQLIVDSNNVIYRKGDVSIYIPISAIKGTVIDNYERIIIYSDSQIIRVGNMNHDLTEEENHRIREFLSVLMERAKNIST